MRGLTTLVQVVPRGGKVLALKARAILVEGNPYDLFSELWLARREMQSIIDTLWELGKMPTLSQAHQMFYRVLR